MFRGESVSHSLAQERNSIRNTLRFAHWRHRGAHALHRSVKACEGSILFERERLRKHDVRKSRERRIVRIDYGEELEFCHRGLEIRTQRSVAASEPAGA